jgi:hypothetical protein
MEWFLRYGDTLPRGIGDITGSTNTTILAGDSDLTQDTDFWLGGWYYHIPADTADASEERLIIGSSSGGQLDLEYPLSSEPTSDDFYEIWDGWPPSQVNNAVNRALRHAWRFWPNVVEADLVLSDKLAYGISGSDFNNNGDPGTNDFPNVAEVLQIWLEDVRNMYTGQLTSTNATATIFSDTLSLWTTNAVGDVVDTDWLISIYEGPGVGELRQLNTWDSDGVFTVDTAWTVAPDTNSKWAAWNPSTDNQEEWYRIFAARFDEIENPNVAYLMHNYPSAYGARLRIKYLAQSSDFAADSDETRVPLEYLQYKAMSFLYSEMVGDNQHDRASNAGQAEYYGQLADDLVHKDTPTQPAGTLWQERDHQGFSGGQNRINPLDWPGR